MKKGVVKIPNENVGNSVSQRPFLKGSMVPTPPTSRSTGSDSTVLVPVSNLQVPPTLATLSSALTDVWNNSATSDAAKPATEIRPQTQVNPSPRNIKITCLFCCKLMFQRVLPEVEGDEVKANRNKRLKNLCNELNLNMKEIPDVCSKDMFPFCNGCWQNVDKLWELKQELKQIQLMMLSTVQEIQRKVVGGETIKSKIKRPNHPLVLEAEARKFTRLREMILEAYHEASPEDVSQHQDSLVEKSSAEGDAGVDGRASESFLSTSVENKTVGSGGHSKPALNQKKNNVPKTMIRTSRADDENRAGPSSKTRPPLTKVANSSSVSTATRINSNKETNSNKFSVNKQLPSTSKTGTATTAGGGFVKRTRSETISSANLIPSVVLTPIDPEILKNIKTEAAAAVPQVDQDGFEWESEDEDILLLAVRKRRQLFEGVEIIRCENPAKKEFLQCNLCSFTIPITKIYMKGNTPYLRMKSHINYIHTQKDEDNDEKESKPAPPPIIFECDFCAETFSTQESFQEHKTTHPDHGIPSQECDICHRPMKFNSASNTNLLRHKFSHKNDEERRAALEAGEKGAYYAFLEKTDKSTTQKNHQRLSHFSSKNRAAGLAVGKKTVLGFPTQHGNHHVCHICQRSFPRKNSLTLHVKSHKRKAKIDKKRISSAPSSYEDVEVLKVKRLKKKNPKYEQPPILFPITPQTNVAEMATQTSPKKTKACKEDKRAQEEEVGSESGTSVETQQEDDTDGILPILKREVQEEDHLMETDV